MKKHYLLFAVILAALLLTGCGGKKKSEGVSVDVNKLCKDLQGTIQGDLNEVSTDILASTYFLDMEKIEESTAALNSGASACEVVVIKCKDSSYVSEAEELFKNRVASQTTLFASYDAAEVSKLDATILKSAGNYVVFCVTDDTAKADEIIKEAGF